MLTLVLLSRDNIEYLPRVLEYYKTLKFGGRIFVLDSSTQETKDKVKIIIDKFKDELFEPKFIDCNAQFSFSEQLYFVMQFVCTPYTLLASLDDFFSIQGMYEALFFLKNNPDYLFAYGYPYGFTFTGDDLNFFYTGDLVAGVSFSNDDPFTRVDSFFTKYVSTIHTIFRTNGLRFILEKCAHYASDDYGKFLEHMFTVLALLSGKGIYLAKPFAFREFSNTSGGAINRQKWLLADDFEANKRSMELGLQEYFKEKFFMEHSKAHEQAVRISDRVIEENFCSVYGLWESKKTSVRDVIKKTIVPSFFLARLRIIRDHYALERRRQNCGENFLKNQASPYFDELKLVKKLIKNSGITAYRDGIEYLQIDKGCFQNSDHA